MTIARFRVHDSSIVGFTIQGHSGYAKAGEDIVCSAVSSAAYLTINTLVDIFSQEAKIDCRDGFMSFYLNKGSQTAGDILEGLRQHLSALSEQYPQFLKVYSEV